MLNIDSYTPKAYSDHDAETAVAFANYAAIALHNAALYESERRQREIAETIRDTTTAVASSLEQQQVLLTLATRLREISGFHACTIYEWDRASAQARALFRARTGLVDQPGECNLQPPASFQSRGACWKKASSSFCSSMTLTPIQQS